MVAQLRIPAATLRLLLTLAIFVLLLVIPESGDNIGLDHFLINLLRAILLDDLDIWKLVLLLFQTLESIQAGFEQVVLGRDLHSLLPFLQLAIIWMLFRKSEVQASRRLVSIQPTLLPADLAHLQQGHVWVAASEDGRWHLLLILPSSALWPRMAVLLVLQGVPCFDCTDRGAARNVVIANRTHVGHDGQDHARVAVLIVEGAATVRARGHFSSASVVF